MGTLRAVAAFGKPFIAVGEVHYLLLSVDVWTDTVFITFGVDDNEVIARLRSEYDERMREWIDRGRLAGHEPPSAPSSELLSSALLLDDGVGTGFTSMGGSAGGTGSEWRVERMFRPGPAKGARALTLAPSLASMALTPSPYIVNLTSTSTSTAV